MSISRENSDILSRSGSAVLPKTPDELSNIKSPLKNFFVDEDKEIFRHLTDCIKRVLEERPENAADCFEDVSKRIGKGDAENRIKPSPDVSLELAVSKIEKSVFEEFSKETEREDFIESPLPPLSLNSFFYEQSGVGLSRQEYFRVWMALKSLVNTEPLQTARFWGKILGTEQDYYIAEVERREGEDLEEEEEETAEDGDGQNQGKENDDEEDEEGNEEAEDKPPKSNWKAPPKVPKEEFRTGANKKLYYVCNTPNSTWKMLPHVTPAQIQASRKTVRLFTGRLDAEVKSAEKFPGLEASLLRAQIARISAGTQISPNGFFTYENEEEEEAEENAEPEDPMKNEEYAPLSAQELLDLSNWKHHTRHILPQGRCSWWNPSQKQDDEFEEDDDEGEGENEDGEAAPEPEYGPTLLTPVSEDAAIENLVPWSLRLSSDRLTEYAVVVASSNLWPGAHAFSFGKHCENIYIGWGYKADQSNHSPVKLEKTMNEFEKENEVTEIADPTPEEEAAVKAKKGGGDEEQLEEEQEEMEDEDN